MITVYSMPFEDHSNPYFALWRRSLGRFTDRITLKPIEGSFIHFAICNGHASDQPRILCIHWSTVLYGSRFFLKSIMLLIINFTALWYLKTWGKFKVVWIIHNAHAHDYPHPRVDAIGRALLRSFADTLIAQQRSTKDHLQIRYSNTPCFFVPHGNYIGAYGPEQPSTKNQFGYEQHHIVLAVFGSIRPYKKIDRIITEFKKTHNDSLRLFIAGKGGGSKYIAHLKKLAQPDSRIRIEPHFIPDADISMYFATADYSIFYYDESELTSGGIMLSLSYGIPVVTRNIASAEMIRPGVNGFIFSTDNELGSILENSLHPRDSRLTEAARTSVEVCNWDEIALQYLATYETMAREQ